MARPYQKANIPGPEMGTSVSDPVVIANILKKQMKNIGGLSMPSKNERDMV